MKKLSLILIIGSVFSLLSMRVMHAATVTVDENKVTVDQNGSTTVVQQTPVVAVPVVQTVTVEPVDPRKVEGEIINVDMGHGPEAKGQITVRDIDGREKRIDLKPGMIGNYKVGDYVEVYLMADMQEAKTIHTRRIADIEGEIVTLDYANNLLILRDGTGANRNVLIRPALIQAHKVGDRVRIYVVQNEPDPSTVRLIRVG